jgi:hypothetical protein
MVASANRAVSPSLYLMAGFLIGALVVGIGWLPSRGTNANVVYDVTVDYMYETAPSVATGQKAWEVASIEFKPGLLVVTGMNGTTTLFALSRLRNFSYTPTVQS